MNQPILSPAQSLSLMVGQIVEGDLVIKGSLVVLRFATSPHPRGCMCTHVWHCAQDKSVLSPDEVALLTLLEDLGERLSIRRQCLGADRLGNK